MNSCILYISRYLQQKCWCHSESVLCLYLWWTLQSRLTQSVRPGRTVPGWMTQVGPPQNAAGLLSRCRSSQSLGRHLTQKTAVITTPSMTYRIYVCLTLTIRPNLWHCAYPSGNEKQRMLLQSPDARISSREKKALCKMETNAIAGKLR